MARQLTARRVHDAALALVAESGYTRLTMEGIAARAGVGKQTLYRSWSGTGDIVIDALLARSADEDGAVVVPDTGDLRADLVVLVEGTVAEFADPALDRVLRACTAEMQVDPALAAKVRDGLLRPQLAAVEARLRAAGVMDAAAGAELLQGPLLHRWLLRTGPFESDWPPAHVDRVLRALEFGERGPR